jgi:hypothetical protein
MLVTITQTKRRAGQRCATGHHATTLAQGMVTVPWARVRSVASMGQPGHLAVGSGRCYHVAGRFRSMHYSSIFNFQNPFSD